MASLLRQTSSSSSVHGLGKRKKEVVEEASAAGISAGSRRNKQRVLLIPSRGVTSQMRHLVGDLEALMPQCKKDSKLDSKSNLHLINELAELNNCNNTLYFEARKHQDLYLWASKTPNGPSAKLYVQNIHTMDELKMTGNCLKGSRPVLSFDQSFETGDPHWGLLKEMFVHMFGVPRSSRRTKPFVDHVMSFSIVDGKIWCRNYQIIEKDPGKSAVVPELGASGRAQGHKAGALSNDVEPTLVEIGPRFVMTPIRVFEGSFGGATLYENPEYLSPNSVRHLQRRKKGDEYKSRTAGQDALRAKIVRLQREKEPDELARNRVFA